VILPEPETEMREKTGKYMEVALKLLGSFHIILNSMRNRNW